MAQLIGNKEYNTFIRGFISEATALNFPENATIDESNFSLHRSGKRTRRLGMDYEPDFELIDIFSEIPDPRSGAIKTVFWDADVLGNVLTILVVQHGNSLSFFNASGTPVTGSRLNQGQPLEIGGNEDQPINATTIGGKLVVVNGQKGFIVLTYDPEQDLVVKDARLILVRDIWGVDDGRVVTERTSTFALTDKMEYNLVNQGWGGANPGGGNQPYYRSAAATMGQYPSNADIASAGKDPTDDNNFNANFMRRVFFGNTPAPKGFFVIDAFKRGSSRNALMRGKTLASKYEVVP